MNFINFRNFQTLQTARGVALWLIASLAVALIFFQEFWASLGTMLSPDWIFGQYQASPWGVLLLCLIWLWRKRKNVWREMLEGSQVRKLEGSKWGTLQTFKLMAGMGLVVGAIFMPSSRDFMVFQVLLASLGVFVLFFGKAARIPSILLGIYGFVISFPLTIERFAELPYSMSAMKPMMWILNGLGYSLHSQGQWLHFTSSSGESVSVAVTAACAGPATMGVLLALFVLMMLDTPLSPRKAGYVFLFGVVGTWLQSVIRLIILMVVGYHLGEDAMWTTHFWTIYILFPLWYLLFAYIYFRQAGALRRTGRKASAQIGRTNNAEA